MGCCLIVSIVEGIVLTRRRQHEDDKSAVGRTVPKDRKSQGEQVVQDHHSSVSPLCHYNCSHLGLS